MAFAKAGAKHLVLIGRTESNLIETQNLLPSGTCTSSVIAASVTDEGQMKQAASAVGTWDVLVMNAGYMSPGPITTSDLAGYWQNYEVSSSKNMVILIFLITDISAVLDECQINRGSLASLFPKCKPFGSRCVRSHCGRLSFASQIHRWSFWIFEFQSSTGEDDGIFSS